MCPGHTTHFSERLNHESTAIRVELPATSELSYRICENPAGHSGHGDLPGGGAGLVNLSGTAAPL